MAGLSKKISEIKHYLQNFVLYLLRWLRLEDHQTSAFVLNSTLSPLSLISSAHLQGLALYQTHKACDESEKPSWLEHNPSRTT